MFYLVVIRSRDLPTIKDVLEIERFSVGEYELSRCVIRDDLFDQCFLARSLS